VSTLRTGKRTIFHRKADQVPVNASNRTMHQGIGKHQGPHSAMPGGHSTLNTVVLGEGVSKSKYTLYFGHHSCMLLSDPAAPRPS